MVAKVFETEKSKVNEMAQSHIEQIINNPPTISTVYKAPPPTPHLRLSLLLPLNDLRGFVTLARWILEGVTVAKWGGS